MKRAADALYSKQLKALTRDKLRFSKAGFVSDGFGQPYTSRDMAFVAMSCRETVHPIGSGIGRKNVSSSVPMNEPQRIHGS